MTGGRIPQPFIDDLLARTDIVDVVDARVPLRKAGREFSACCPFHKEKTPSFFVNREKQFYHCFGCGAHGSAISFLMEFDGATFLEAVADLAHRLGLEVPHEGAASGQAEQSLAPLYNILQQAAEFYQKQLRQHPQSQQAVDYLKKRGIQGEIAARFGIGFAPPGWHNLLAHLGRDPSSRELLIKAGLVADKGTQGGYDQQRNRIVFPIRDQRGRVIGFGGRTMGDDKPKYLNSPESPVFHKGRELYGLYEARQADRQLQRVLVVEGYMDVVSLAQAGITQVVATLGTATTRDHLTRLFRQVNDVVFCFDGDAAGRQAAWRALETALPEMREGRQISFMFLPEGEDPDSIIKKGVDAFHQRIATAVPFSQFLFELMLKKADISNIDGRAKLVELTRPLLTRMPVGVYRHMLMSRLAELAQISVDVLDGDGPAVPQTPKPAQRRVTAAASAGGPSLVRRALQLLLADPRLALLELPLAEFAGLKNPRFVLILEVIASIRRQPEISTGMILERCREIDQDGYLAKVLQLELPPQELWENEFRACMDKLVSHIKEHKLDSEIKELNNCRGADIRAKAELLQEIKSHKAH